MSISATHRYCSLFTNRIGRTLCLDQLLTLPDHHWRSKLRQYYLRPRVYFHQTRFSKMQIGGVLSLTPTPPPLDAGMYAFVVYTPPFLTAETSLGKCSMLHSSQGMLCDSTTNRFIQLQNLGIKVHRYSECL